VTFTTPGAESVLRRTIDRLEGRIILGAGTVLTADDVRRAAECGATFVVSPSFEPTVVEAAKRLGLVAMPGAFSPTEIVAAWHAGADLVKVFPAESLGPGFFRALRGPLPMIPLMATGGIDAGNGAAYLAAGAAVLGVGGKLVDPALVRDGRFEELTNRARALVEITRRP
jgi:2-dehydro-3-deoxyphosphogluconate aldolase/(4S)-4-hydroxy-2-oxoglutarate aldolase